jgi:hypothetical protein
MMNAQFTPRTSEAGWSVVRILLAGHDRVLGPIATLRDSQDSERHEQLLIDVRVINL